MLNVHDLERRWLKYKIKSYLPHFFIFIAVVVAVAISTVYLSSRKDAEMKESTVLIKEKVEPTTFENSSITNVHEKAAPKINVLQNTIERPLEQSNNLVLEPSLHFMDNIEEGLNPYVEVENVQEVPTKQITNNVNTVVQQTENVKSVEIEAPVEEKKQMLTITKNEDESDIKDVIRRFKQNKNPALSLFIAKRYYEIGQYQNSYNYALMTNEIDKSIDASWIIFSKSLVKLGQKELAILTLKSYLKTTKSTQAEILLRKIESGDFK